tara:strand:- start:6696 stop:7511 length:816 start_codon:yes stop_codon:yes gene_type:complete
MIGFNYLGTMGQLGNQMFQYASLRGIAKNRGFEFCIPYHQNVFDDGIGNKLRIELFDPFVMKNVTQLNIQTIDQDRPVTTEREFSFNEDIFNNCPDWTSLQGYFQTEKYFKNVEDIIREDFTFKNEISVPCKHKMSEVDRPIALHIRRGDFLTNSANHHNLGLDYYEKALSKFDSDRTVIIFSDDPEWCQEQDLFSDDRFLVCEGNTSYVDLCLMSLCTDFIIANSTFSWWGAWLSRSVDKVVCAPSIWFGPNNAHLDASDIIPDSWEIVE